MVVVPMEHRVAAVVSMVIDTALRGERFRPRDIRRRFDDPPSQREITRVLQQLETECWVQPVDGVTELWEPAENAVLLANPEIMDTD